jgi:ATP-dependent DNA ligase
LHEVKFDGFRFQARRDAVGVRLLTRRGNPATAPYFEYYLRVQTSH